MLTLKIVVRIIIQICPKYLKSLFYTRCYLQTNLCNAYDHTALFSLNASLLSIVIIAHYTPHHLYLDDSAIWYHWNLIEKKNTILC